jgi:hypothetical protein
MVPLVLAVAIILTIGMVKLADMTKAELLVAYKKKGTKKGKGKGKGGTRKKQGFLAQAGIYPLNLSKAVITGGGVNLLTSNLLGRDLENEFHGSGSSASTKDILAGKGRIDIPDFIAEMNLDESLTFGTKTARVLRVLGLHAQATATTWRGAKRSLAPLAAGLAFRAGARVTKANLIVPPAIRKHIRFS